ncbi:MAG: Tfp pilus assembly protein, tip-associated adhesin PilY1 [Candidatus Accumulibacter adjunctus]|uniref:Tfp pilus assembly protein, tip-associated adhesin PilY1 n=1 Tax=Candidatus Accumulibacter adjunctus TaxID=1454001 RepID=A0A011MFW3_9PROT|nr:MAG: Tfp pilus assembly protein, tip-associated adhesin PilY1 [Candidatus Accumulibacter adjunctus]
MTAAIRTIRSIALLSMLMLGGNVVAAPTQLANSPISGASSVEIAPNILFVLDDSGSMDWDYLPDWAGLAAGLHQAKNAGFNGLAYNPAVTYLPPKYFDASGAPDTTTYPSQTSANSSAWTSVKDDGYGVQSTGRSNLIGIAYYYTTVAGEYCTNQSMKTCVAATAPSATYPVAARLRWCRTAADATAATPTAGACQATQIDPNPGPPATPTNIPYNFPRMPAPRASVLTISGSSSTSVSSITVGGQQILSAATPATSSPALLAGYIESAINACSFTLVSPCQVVGYRAVAVGDTVTISAPGLSSATPVLTQSGTMTLSATAFARPANNLAPGENLLTVITPSVTLPAKAATRSDCAADPCTNAEEMTNYANWWAYYRTRMQSMKTASSLSFQPIGSSYRIGYMSINNNTTLDFQNIDTFSATQKKAWYDKVFAAVPNQNTPLRVALANAGRLYAGRLNGSTLNGVSVVDPVQFYCQPNVTLLSTDGYWNQGAGFQWDGTTAVGDQDGPGLEVRPQLDGGPWKQQRITTQITETQTPTQATQAQVTSSQLQSLDALVEERTFTQPQESTSRLQSMDGQWQTRTSELLGRTYTQAQTSTLTQLQRRRMLLQSRTGPLQQRNGTLQTRSQTQMQTRTAQLQSMTAQLQSKTYQLQQRLTQVQQRTSTNSGTTWSAWTDTTSCSQLTKGATGTNRTECRVLPQTAWTDVSSCSVAAGGAVLINPGLDSEAWLYTTDSQCQYTSPSWVNAASCTAVAKSPGPTNYTVGTAVDCQTTWPNPWVNASSCTRSPTVDCRYDSWTGYSNVSSCTAQAQSSGPDYTVGLARECLSNQWTPWTNASGSCTSSSTVECQYLWTGWNNVSSCTANPASTASPYSVTSPVECQVAYGSWSSPFSGSCTEVTTGANRTQCQYTGSWQGGNPGWSNVASCSAVAPSTGPTYTTVVECQTVWTTFTNTASCTANATTQCQTTWTGWNPVPSCTVVAGQQQCGYGAWSGYSNVASCSPVNKSPGPTNYTVALARECNPTWPNAWVDATSCTVSSTSSLLRQCQYTAWSGYTDTGSCTAVARSTGPTSYSVGVARQCQTTWTPWSAVASCTPVSGSRECQTSWPNPWVNASTCTPSATQQCRDLAVVGSWTNVASCTPGTVAGLTTSCQYVVPPPTSQFVASCTPGTSGTGVVTSCSTDTQGPVDVASCTPAPASSANNYVQTTCPIVALGPTSDTLADVAEYYWKTDLRDPSQTPDRCTGGPVVAGGVTTQNNVCTNDTKYPRQYMSTYTLGLGASGLMQYQADYLTAASGDFNSVKLGLVADPSTGTCPWQTIGECNWPKPESNTQSNIDDLWHAAVNGRGTYFSATDPSSLAAGISGALQTVTVRDGALAAVTVTTANLAAGSNEIFEVSFRVGEWSGDIVKRTIDGTTGAISSTPAWSAQAQLDTKVSAGTHTARTIYLFESGGNSSGSGVDNLKFFLWANLSTSQKNNFLSPHIDTLTQLCSIGTTCLTSTAKASAEGENLLNFIRGDKSNEGPLADLGKYYRQRTHILGDIVGSEAVYVKGSPWNYVDYNYAGFKTANQSRTAMVYVGANDGMLHAFDASTGEEAWAYVPGAVLSRLFKLADKNYGAQNVHQFTVDGTPVVGDVCVSDCATPASGSLPTVWKTILVGGLNNGGRGYYALDITNPAAPKALWEFTHSDLGYSYGNPVITKLKDGTWVVLVTSGYNNLSPGDGGGHLFIIRASDGVLLRTISTGAGDTTTPSGLSRITAWANFPDANNTAQRVYGGDQLGNLWRFDVNGDIPLPAVPPATPVYDAQRLATLKDPSGVAQPITTRPELGKVGQHAVVYVGTGQLLGTDDLATTQTQTIYAIKDRLLDEDYGSPRPLSPPQTTPPPGDFVAQTLTSATCPTGNPFCTAGRPIVLGTSNPVDFDVNDGWYADFPVAGERINTELRLQLGTLALNTNTPTLGACVPVGVSFAYFFDYSGGSPVDGTNGLSGIRLGDYLSSAPSVIRLVDGTIKELIRTDAPGTISTPVPTAPSPLDTRRVSWRELVTEQ